MRYSWIINTKTKAGGWQRLRYSNHTDMKLSEEMYYRQDNCTVGEDKVRDTSGL